MLPVCNDLDFVKRTLLDTHRSGLGARHKKTLHLKMFWV